MTTASISRWEHYYTPATVAEALEILRRYDGRARVVGGGTDLLVETRRGLHRPVDAMVDVSATHASMNKALACPRVVASLAGHRSEMSGRLQEMSHMRCRRATVLSDCWRSVAKLRLPAQTVANGCRCRTHSKARVRASLIATGKF
jgi:hypothetical protein